MEAAAERLTEAAARVKRRVFFLISHAALFRFNRSEEEEEEEPPSDPSPPSLHP